MRSAVLTILAILLFAAVASGGELSSLFGKVDDARSTPVSDALVLVQSESTGARWQTRSDDDGRYSVAGLPMGRYKVTARLPGFRTVSKVGAVLDSTTGLRIDFVMELLGLHEVITVTTGRDLMNPSVASSLLVTRENGGATLPANGGDYRALFDLMPGVLATPASTGDAGQFTSNGQRPNSNTFRVDGMSANTGIGNSVLPGAFPGASLPAMNAIGSTENLVSSEMAQSVELRTSDFSPEFSDRPGAEALVHTRSGSSSFHAEFFEHIRDNGWNARDWFANSRGLPFPRPYYLRRGLAVGGPVWRNRTFFFFSGESSTLDETGTQLTSVPSMATRQTAPDKVRQILNYYPLPIGQDLGGGEAVGLISKQQFGRLFSGSLRIDHTLGETGNLFVRIVESPSWTQGYEHNRFNWASLTAGVTLKGSGSDIHDLRFNFSRADLLYSSSGSGSVYADAMMAVAGLLPGFSLDAQGYLEYTPTSVDLISVLPRQGAATTVMGLSVPGLGQFLSYGGGKAWQPQWELRQTFSRTRGRHEFRAGGDYVLLQPTRYIGTYAILGEASSLEALVQSQPLAVTISSPGRSGGQIHKVSLFAQDTFRLSERLSLLYGLGWDFTPPTSSPSQIPTASGLWTGTEWQDLHGGDINGVAAWPMRYTQIAPRIGVAYRPPVAGFVIRAGLGAFHDTTLGAAVNPINGAPFNSWLLGANGTGLDSSTGGTTTSTPGSGGPPPEVVKFVAGSYPEIRLPVSYQWRLSAERELGLRGVASLAYLGSVGRHLLGHQAYVEPATGVLQRIVAVTQNSSSYQSLQARYSGALARSVYGSVSYTWSHSIDDGSQDSSIFLIHPGYRLNEARGSSSFDVRHVLTSALSYRLPRTAAGNRLPPGLADWTVSGTLRARTGFPMDIVNNDQPLGQGFDNVGRPDRIPGVPIWIDDSSVAGHRRLNAAAFHVPDNGAPGTLGRNVINGNGLAQFDASVRREFPVFRGLSVQVALSVFNVLNHPTFADPVRVVSSPWFGQSTSMQNLMLGSGSPNTGLAPLFQTGGPRSAEFSFRVSF